MPRLFLIGAITASLLMPGTANACIPPMVEFAYASERLPQKAQREIALVLKMARADPHARVKLTATTDGSRPNRQMAQRGANVIKAVLARGGVNERRIDVEYIDAVSDGSARLVFIELVSAPTCGS
jgi:outer membrane protein OmpA-like peptidoglycan-associated protein